MPVIQWPTVGCRGLAAPLARVAGGLGLAASDGAQPRARCNATAAICMACGTSPPPWRSTSRSGDHPLRPPRLGRDPGVSPRPVPVPGRRPRTSSTPPFPCKTYKPPATSAVRRELREHLNAPWSLADLLNHPQPATSNQQPATSNPQSLRGAEAGARAAAHLKLYREH